MYGEALLVVAVVFGAARLAGVDGVWLSVTVVQAILTVCAAALLRRRHRSRSAQGCARATVGDGAC